MNFDCVSHTTCGSKGLHTEMSQIKKTEEVLEESTSNLETTKEESRDETPETSTGTSRVSILFREITKQLRNQLLNSLTRQEGSMVSDQVPQRSENSLIKEIDLSKEMHHGGKGHIMMDTTKILQDCKVWDKEKHGQLNPISDLDKGLISKTGDDHPHDILSQVHAGVYQTSELYLDMNTVGNNVVVRGDLKYAFWTVEDLCYTKSRKRFKDPQVLSMNSFNSGQHFWVVETSKSGNWRIGMCYPSIARKGFRSYIGCSNKSWALCKWNNEYSVMHNCKEILLSPRLSCQKIGIFLDYNAGQLSFYELGNPVRLLHTFTATFIEPLHAAFRIWLDSLGSSWILIRD